MIERENLGKLKIDPRLSPDGKRTAYVVFSNDNHEQKYDSHIYVYNIEENNTEPWTVGEGQNHSPRWSPDGSKLAFISHRNGRVELNVLPTRAGKEDQLTTCQNGVSHLQWSSDNKKILISVLLPKMEESEVGENMTNKFTGKQNTQKQIATVDVETGEIEIILKEAKDYQNVTWSADGRNIGYTMSNVEEPLLSDIYLYDVYNRTEKQITENSGVYSSLSFSPDGTVLAFIGREKEDHLNRLSIYHLIEEEITCLTIDLDVHIGGVIGDHCLEAVDPNIQWTADGQGFYFLVSDKGDTGIYYGSIEGFLFPVRFENEHVCGFSVNGATHEAVAVIRTVNHHSDFYYFDFKNGDLKLLT